MFSLIHRACASVIPAQYRPHMFFANRLLARSGGRVMTGPFRGLTMVVDLAVIDWPAILGTWEQELHPLLERIIAAPPPVLINIGAAEGYYTVGLAVRCPNLTSLAFEQRPEMQAHITKLAAANKVADRTLVQGWCGREEFAEALAAHSGGLVLMDIEGGEVELLDPELFPALREFRILVEEHEVFVPGCVDILKARFTPTHRIEIIPGVPRTPADLPVRWPMATKWLMRLASEGRSRSQSWLYMTPLGTAQ